MPVQARRAAPTGTAFAAAVRRFIGVPYEWGGASPRGFDCSGLVEYTLTRLGVPNVPRTSEEQWKWVQRVSYGSVQPGDLVFMNFPGETSPGHVMVASRPGYVIQAPRPGEAVQEVPFRPLPPGSSEWGGTIVGYGRVPGLSYPRDRAGARARPPRPGNPDNPGGAPDPSSGADGSAADAWTRYADELAAPTTSSSSGGFASLHFFGIPIPGTGWVPSWLDPSGSLGVPGLDVWNPLSIFGDAAGAVSGADSFFHWVAWIFHPRNVLRIVEALFGAALILVGLSFARTGSSSGDEGSSLGRKASGLFAATPIGREYRLAKAAAGGKSAARRERGLARAKAQRKREAFAFKRAKEESRKPSETREQHRARRAKQRRDEEVPF